MKFATLGDDPDCLALAAAAEQLGHKVTRCEEQASDQENDLWRGAPDPGTCDAVLVGPSDEQGSPRSEQLQELVKMGLPVLAVHPVVPEVLAYFEIDMARGETQALLQHYNPLTECNLLPRLAEWITDGHPEVGKIEQVVAERTFDHRTREAVLDHFARDVELLIRIAGPLDRIGALGSGNDDAAYAGLSVQLLGKQAVPVRWSVGPVSDSPGLKIELVGERGRVTEHFDASNLRMEQESHESTDPAVSAVSRFVNGLQADTDESTWPAALQAMELADSIEISLRRGRMIDVHHQQLTEHLAFKGTMAALGCGVLMVLPPLLLLVGWIAGLFGIPVAEYWPHALLVLLALFLGLQVLPKIVYAKK
ncbi:hypothetical protein [Adhaeretor mobilis]|uniref:Uncharacterized protein n=1 Tax=Adhaeretor mobilis TaxID=1930276 RepID=A0A517MUV1_9BACT|nr:hypothetical protein [Adhaeretor mobilis]QDS98663.1 hypothetical protein HG15A2_19440 [Adhaeretor mobilis]